MKNGGHHQSKSFLHRWLSRTNNYAHDVPSDEESERSITSPPPLTESSSTTDTSSFPPPTPAPATTKRVVVSSLKPVKPIPINPAIQRVHESHSHSRPTHHSRTHNNNNHAQEQHRVRLLPEQTEASFKQSTISFPTSSDSTTSTANPNAGGGGLIVAKHQPLRSDIGHGRKPSLQITRVQTPRLKGTQPARLPSSRVKTPWTPPSRTIMLPDFDDMTTPKARHVTSLPPNAHRPLLHHTIELHPLVAHHPTRRTIMWDLVLPLQYAQKYSSPVAPSVASQMLVNHSTSKALYGCSRLCNEEWSEYISNPPVRRVRVITDLFKWPVDVYAQSVLPNDPKAFLSVKDVLYAVYDMARHPASDSEFHNAPPRFREQLKKARERRLVVRSAIDISSVEQKKGMRRVDYLLDMTMFAGFERRESDARDDLRRNDGFITLFLKLDPHWS